ncbi:MAG: hypothetical protein QM639_06780 [Rhodocyclaceae bacterium]
MQFKHLARRTLMAAMLVALAACGGDDDDDGPQSGASSSVSSSTGSNGSNDSGNSGTPDVAGTKTCPDSYHSYTVKGSSSLLNANISIRAPGGNALLLIKTPATSTGPMKLCIGIPDSALLPKSGAGTRNYEILGEGNYTAVQASLKLGYAAPGTYDVNYLAIPAAAGQYGRYDAQGNLRIDRNVRTATYVDEDSNVLVVDAIKPGLYMTTDTPR